MIYPRQTDLPYPQPWEFVYENFFKDKKDLFYVDVGANDGLLVSNTAFFELDMNWIGICIEPHPLAFSKLETNRKCVKYNCCISDESTTLEYNKVSGYAEMLSGIRSVQDDQHMRRIMSEIQKHGGTLEVINVESKRLDAILNENNIQHVDYLSIDTEGAEMKVLSSLDLTAFDIKVISAENSDTNATVRDFLNSKGYDFITKVCSDEIFVKRNP